MKVLRKGFNYSQDGPGNRLVYHLQGCNFHCKWCSNPESIPGNNPKNTEMSPDDILKEALSCKPMFFDGGGVCFTGGEPTLWHNELLETLKKLKENSINTCLETNGSDEKLNELLPYIDFLIIDLKHPSEDIHEKWTGVKNTITKNNISSILDSKRQVLIRIPLINKVNVVPDLYCEFFSKHNMDNATIEILPYHEYGKGKWTEKYEIEDGFVTNDIIKMMRQSFINKGYKVINT